MSCLLSSNCGGFRTIARMGIVEGRAWASRGKRTLQRSVRCKGRRGPQDRKLKRDGMVCHGTFISNICGKSLCWKIGACTDFASADHKKVRPAVRPLSQLDSQREEQSRDPCLEKVAKGREIVFLKTPIEAVKRLSLSDMYPQ